jgi:hypothetical protein
MGTSTLFNIWYCTTAYRITFTATVSFFWLIILSSIASKTPVIGDDDDDDDEYEECSLVDGLTCNIDG